MDRLVYQIETKHDKHDLIVSQDFTTLKEAYEYFIAMKRDKNLYREETVTLLSSKYDDDNNCIEGSDNIIDMFYVNKRGDFDESKRY